MNHLKILSVFMILFSCTNTENYKQDLLSDDKEKIINACYQLGENKDTSAVKSLLNKALDPRITHDIRFIGATVNCIRLTALQKISNDAYKEKINRHYLVDTTATMFFLDWAVKKGYIKDQNEINIYYFNE